MIHTYSLIHDDLPAMDDDDIRRGQPSNHRQYDEATAILAGDALIALAFEVLARDTRGPAEAAACVIALAAAAGATQLVGGQADDLAFEFSNPDVEMLQEIHRRKTGALLAISVKLGGLTAGATAEQLRYLEIYGEHLGLAFQIADDLLDLRGEQVKMGKRTQKDLDQGKLTYPQVLGVEQSEIRARQLVEAAVGAIQPLGRAGELLETMARYVIERTN
jgi:geranylgeranyl diphosphate synthase type II